MYSLRPSLRAGRACCSELSQEQKVSVSRLFHYCERRADRDWGVRVRSRIDGEAAYAKVSGLLLVRFSRTFRKRSTRLESCLRQRRSDVRQLIIYTVVSLLASVSRETLPPSIYVYIALGCLYVCLEGENCPVSAVVSLSLSLSLPRCMPVS